MESDTFVLLRPERTLLEACGCFCWSNYVLLKDDPSPSVCHLVWTLTMKGFSFGLTSFLMLGGKNTLFLIFSSLTTREWQGCDGRKEEERKGEEKGGGKCGGPVLCLFYFPSLHGTLLSASTWQLVSVCWGDGEPSQVLGCKLCVLTGWQCHMGDASCHPHVALPHVLPSLVVFPFKKCKRDCTKATLLWLTSLYWFFFHCQRDSWLRSHTAAWGQNDLLSAGATTSSGIRPHRQRPEQGPRGGWWQGRPAHLPS